MKYAFLLIFFFLPAFASAEDLLPAICAQILTPDKNTSVVDVIRRNVVERVREIPNLVMNDLGEAVNGGAESLAENLESHKKGGVLGASTSAVDDLSFFDSLYNKALGALAFLIRHWLWTLAGFGVVAFLWLLRP